MTDEVRSVAKKWHEEWELVAQIKYSLQLIKICSAMSSLCKKKSQQSLTQQSSKSKLKASILDKVVDFRF